MAERKIETRPLDKGEGGFVNPEPGGNVTLIDANSMHLPPEAILPSNSKAERKKPGKVIDGKAEVAPNRLRKAERALVAEDAGTVKDYLLWDVLLPAMRDTIVDLIKKVADAIFYGNKSGGASNVERRNGTSYVRYDKASYRNDPSPFDDGDRYSRSSRNDPSPFDDGDRYSRSSRRPRRSNDVEDVLLRDREDAEAILDQMVELTLVDGQTSVADFYELAGLEAAYTDERWGWTDLSSATIERTKHGYICVLPRPKPISYR